MAIVVRFDQELGYVHAADRLRCPRGILNVRPAVRGRPEIGSLRTVLPCALSIGHDGACDGVARLNVERTVCGLSMHDSPWTIAPDSATRCPTCFDLAPSPEQEALL